MDPIVKQTLNALRCPICKGQVDLLDWKQKRVPLDYNYCCANDWEHYRLLFVHWEPVLIIKHETVVVYEGRHKYQITQFQNKGTEIFIFDVDLENRVIEDPQKKNPNFSYDKHLFDFSKSNRDKIVNRIKTILVFQ